MEIKIKNRKKKRNIFCRVGKFFLRMELNDRCLVFFMMILLAQMIFTMFFQTPLSNIDESLDVVFRTSIASIFGYFLSANFVKYESGEKRRRTEQKYNNTAQKDNINSTNINSTGNASTIGFVAPNTTISNRRILNGGEGMPNGNDESIAQNNTNIGYVQVVATPPTDLDEEAKEIYKSGAGTIYVQVIVMFSIGMISLIALIVYRNFVASENAPVAVVSQIRDLVAGSIGFLLGIPDINSRD